MLKIKEIKNGQVFYAMDNNGEDYSFKAWGEPALINGLWTVQDNVSDMMEVNGTRFFEIVVNNKEG